MKPETLDEIKAGRLAKGEGGEAAGGPRGEALARSRSREEARLRQLRKYGILDTEGEQCYDDLTRLAAVICGTPIALLTLVDEERVWFKSRLGTDVGASPREWSLCSHAILQPDEVMEVPNLLEDPRFCDNSFVRGGPEARFYCGAPLVTPDGSAIGTVCVVDRVPRALSAEQREALRCLARQAVMQLQLREAIANLERQGLTDGLSGVWNRRAFDLRLREEWIRHCRTGQRLSLLMIDIDRFKQFNDTLGHQEGDRALAATARLLGKTLRAGDYLVRYGGEEFAIILPHSDIHAARATAERLCQLVRSATWASRPVTISIGASVAVPMRDLDRNLLIARADHALYQAKARGRDRAEVFTSWEGGEG